MTRKKAPALAHRDPGSHQAVARPERRAVQEAASSLGFLEAGGGPLQGFPGLKLQGRMSFRH